MSRSRIEGLLASFPKLITAGNQHTFIETDSVRFIYQPLEDLYLSNILQDNDTLQLFSRTVSEYCRSLKEADIVENGFELLLAFDEIISLGYRENVQLPQIRTNTAMESHEEKLQEMLQKSKEREAIENSKLKAKQLEMQRREAAKRGGPSGGGFGSLSTQGGFSSLRSPPLPQSIPEAKPQATFDSRPQQHAPAVKGGIQLGGKPKGADMLAALNIQPVSDEVSATAGNLTQQPQQLRSPVSPSEGVSITIEEKMSAALNKDGGLDNLEVKGDLMLLVSDPAKAKIRIQLNPLDDPNVQFKTNPHVEKNQWQNSRVITTRDPNTPFPVNQAVPVLKWRYVTKDESMVPFSLSFWPAVSGTGTIDCSVEYELLSDSLELKNVVVAIPLVPGAGVPKVSHVDGNYQVNPSTKALEWKIPFMDSTSSSGTFEFSVQGDNSDALFPAIVSFTSDKTYCHVSVQSVVSNENAEPVPFKQVTALIADDYRIV